jgi:polyisoprenoid-binding protein YceI
MTILLLAALLALPTASAPGPRPVPQPRAPSVWKLDPTHSELSFRIRHLVGRVRGTFADWDGAITGDPADWNSGAVEVHIRTASIDTGNENRDNDLRSDRFFGAEQFPQISFRSTSVEFRGDEGTVTGDLTVRDVTRPVVLKAHYLGLAPGKEGRDRVGFEATATINRLDYGVKYNRAVEGGGLLLGDDVDLEFTIEAVRQP